MSRLKNCPKCNGTDVDTEKSVWLEESVIVVRCSGCGINLKRMGKTIHAAKQLAIRDWNERGHDGRHAGKRGTG